MPPRQGPPQGHHARSLACFAGRCKSTMPTSPVDGAGYVRPKDTMPPRMVHLARRGRLGAPCLRGPVRLADWTGRDVGVLPQLRGRETGPGSASRALCIRPSTCSPANVTQAGLSGHSFAPFARDGCGFRHTSRTFTVVLQAPKETDQASPQNSRRTVFVREPAQT